MYVSAPPIIQDQASHLHSLTHQTGFIFNACTEQLLSPFFFGALTILIVQCLECHPCLNTIAVLVRHISFICQWKNQRLRQVQCVAQCHIVGGWLNQPSYSSSKASCTARHHFFWENIVNPPLLMYALGTLFYEWWIRTLYMCAFLIHFCISSSHVYNKNFEMWTMPRSPCALWQERRAASMNLDSTWSRILHQCMEFRGKSDL